ncbi:hypothetical protein ASPACDRAFT_1858539 [Aspergillus aculeatus ATCC 16872]|uniref:Uncharacterized protein n=1 Tax=Aspergillus aculeatus (strain ATCC 16872 / CBS 172.66 / WB 5094) TaxID=690307 RepID=A0A1L9WLQ0_ASPA1|nr:uncharacterized protein ASPACDRAFT_1858539 [Aspergillus aculeatus ATCC 16872]OJJ97074.1 hypothetical protein ASPACDRAFT_1858539 [Aspergillus aculeatus ATCC 16872]
MLSLCLTRRPSSLTRLASSTICQHTLFAHIPSETKYISSTACRLADTSTKDEAPSNTQSSKENTPTAKKPTTDPKSKSVSQADQELRERLEQMSGGGGASGIEYEDGKPTAMKRSVRNNMFRYI